ncbi:helix-turn-helix transcriptional regulator [Frankia sp. CiP3]|uniref:helix-turn-helix transcriptional regulator n=1 Tax=Frankia sp. CiP3 TaxID=2880971 RepID=UPI001EF46B0C|nr:helix-turn-helix transcriptional regulator [Frankia sp. CiP3]
MTPASNTAAPSGSLVEVIAQRGSQVARGLGRDRHPGRPWTVEDPAREAGLSRAAFVKRFATIVGQPPSAYLTWWRMMTVARLLRESKAPLSTVAERCLYAHMGGQCRQRVQR